MTLSKPLTPDDSRHGNRYAYTRYGCRCELCNQANNQYQARSRALRVQRTRENNGIAPGPRTHGEISTAQNWGCNCAPCRKVRAEHQEVAQINYWRKKTEGYWREKLGVPLDTP